MNHKYSIVPFDDEEEISPEEVLDSEASEDSWEIQSDENVSQKNVVVEIKDSQGNLYNLWFLNEFEEKCL